MTGYNFATFCLRIALGITMVAHGYNHAFGGGKLPGTARWFESIGIRPGWLHARLATGTELGTGVMLLFGFLTPLAAAGVVGTMAVALVSNHLKNGFFIFRPGEGYEYVLFIILTAIAMGGVGAGEWSIDNGLGWSWLYGNKGVLISALLGLAGAAALLGVYWRPDAPAPTPPPAEAAKPVGDN